MSDTRKTKSQLIEELESLRMGMQNLETSHEDISHRAREEWENTFNTIRDLIFVTDKDGVVKRLNRSLADKLGSRPQDLIGKTCWDIFKCRHAGTEKCSLVKIKQGLSVREHEAEISLLGMWVLAHVYASYTPSKELDYVIHTYRDITEHKRLEEQLLQLNKTEAVARLAGGIAHEFNNLLTGVIGNLGLAQSQIDKESEEYRFVERAYNAAEKASALVKKLLAFAGKLQVSYSLISVNETVLRVVSLFHEIMDPRIKIIVHIQKDLWPVMADPMHINSILISLLRNAHDAIMECVEGLFKDDCKEKEPFVITINVSNVTVDDEQCRSCTDSHPGGFVLIAISDNGRGMDAGTRKRIFEPFFTTRETGKGKGLGLAAAYGLVKQYKGWINVHSEKGAGTTFEIYLPRAEAL